MNPSRTLKLLRLLTAALAVNLRARCALFEREQEAQARRVKALAPAWHVSLVWFPNGKPEGFRQ